jgi:2-keto-3-deoxy-L-rhamnonate aldolase RhmA
MRFSVPQFVEPARRRIPAPRVDVVSKESKEAQRFLDCTSASWLGPSDGSVSQAVHVVAQVRLAGTGSRRLASRAEGARRW